MTYKDCILTRFESSEGCKFDWKVPRYVENEEGEQVQEHLYVNVIFIDSRYDSIENYVEVDAEGNIIELIAPEDAGQADYVAALAELGVE